MIACAGETVECRPLPLQTNEGLVPGDELTQMQLDRPDHQQGEDALAYAARSKRRCSARLLR